MLWKNILKCTGSHFSKKNFCFCQKIILNTTGSGSENILNITKSIQHFFKDDSFSFQVVRNQPKTRIELIKAREPLISTEDLDDDEHFDDKITDSEQTDTEIQNNLIAFRLKDNAVVDSDVDSDAGNSSTRFSLPS